LAIDKGEIRVAEFSRSQVAALGKALGDPTRLSIYIEIIEHKELYVGELAARRVISMATVSHHLRALTQAGLIMFRTPGTTSSIVRSLHNSSSTAAISTNWLNHDMPV
jgi:DNA-binding transcriptional ArsR family regulator